MATICTFEMIDDNAIILKENGREKETLDRREYDIFASVKERGTVLIPTSYYRLMKNGPSISAIPFNEEEWKATMLPKI